jgi:hypothetical protein
MPSRCRRNKTLLAGAKELVGTLEGPEVGIWKVVFGVSRISRKIQLEELETNSYFDLSLKQMRLFAQHLICAYLKNLSQVLNA